MDGKSQLREITGHVGRAEWLRMGGVKIHWADDGTAILDGPGWTLHLRGCRFTAFVAAADAGPTIQRYAHDAPSPPRPAGAFVQAGSTPAPLLRLGPGGDYRRDIHNAADLEQVIG